jgi:hypothetical protein
MIIGALVGAAREPPSLLAASVVFGGRPAPFGRAGQGQALPLECRREWSAGEIQLIDRLSQAGV